MTTTTEIQIELYTSPTSQSDRNRLMEAPGFGKVFTDLMMLARWTTDKGLA